MFDKQCQNIQITLSQLIARLALPGVATMSGWAARMCRPMHTLSGLSHIQICFLELGPRLDWHSRQTWVVKASHMEQRPCRRCLAWFFLCLLVGVTPSSCCEDGMVWVRLALCCANTCAVDLRCALRFRVSNLLSMSCSAKRSKNFLSVNWRQCHSPYGCPETNA